MTQHLRPISTISAGAWTAFPTTLHGDTDEGIDNPDDEASYAETNADASDMELLLAPGEDPLTGADHQIQWRARRHGVWITTADLTVALYQGAALIATGTSTHGSSYTTETLTLTEAEANSITDYADLRLRIRITIPIGTAHVHFTACEFDIPSLTVHAGQRGRMQSPEVLGEIAQPVARGQMKDTR